MPLARRCTFQLRTLSLFWEVRGGAGGTTTARSGYPPPPDQVHSGPRLAETDAAAISRGRPDHPGGPASLAPRLVSPNLHAGASPSRRLPAAPRAGAGVAQRGAGASPCSLLALRCAAFIAPHPRLNAAPPFGRAACRHRCGAARCRSEPVLAPCLALRRVHCPAPAPQRRAAFRPRRVQAPVWRSEAPARARARSAPSAAPLVALSCLALCCLAVRYQRSLAAISSCGAGRQRRSGRGGLVYPMCVRVGDSASRPAQLGPSASGVA